MDEKKNCSDLVRRLKKAESGSRELSSDISGILGVPDRPYTTDVAAALALFAHACDWRIDYQRAVKGHQGKIRSVYQIKVWRGLGSATFTSHVTSLERLPLALCVAALQSRGDVNLN